MTLLFDSDDLSVDIQRVSADVYDLIRHHTPDEVVFVGILTNGLFFSKRIKASLISRGYMIQTPVMGLDISLYRDDLASKKSDYLTVGSTSQAVNLDNKHVVLFDDVLCTARTARAALNAIFDYGRPSCVRFVTLYDRGHRHVPIEPNVVGRVLSVPMTQRVNVQFIEVTGDDQVITVPFEQPYLSTDTLL